MEEVIICASIVSIVLLLWVLYKFFGLCKDVRTIARAMQGKNPETPQEQPKVEPLKSGEVDYPGWLVALIVVGLVVGLILLIEFA